MRLPSFFFGPLSILALSLPLCLTGCQKKADTEKSDEAAAQADAPPPVPLPTPEMLDRLGRENDLNLQYILPDSLFVLVGQPKKFFASPLGRGNEPFFSEILARILVIPFNMAKIERFVISFSPGIVHVQTQQNGQNVVQPQLLFRRSMTLTFDTELKQEEVLGPFLQGEATPDSLKQKIGEVEYFNLTDPGHAGPQRTVIRFLDNNTLVVLDGFEEDIAKTLDDQERQSPVIDRARRLDLDSTDLAFVASREGTNGDPQIFTELLAMLQEVPRPLAEQLGKHFRAASISLKMEAGEGTPMLDARYTALNEQGAAEIAEMIQGMIVLGQTSFVALDEQIKQTMPFTEDYVVKALDAMNTATSGPEVRFTIDKFDGFEKTLAAGIEQQKVALQQAQLMQAKHDQLVMLSRGFVVSYQQNKKIPSTIRSADGRPLLSWRVSMLPAMGFESLYKEFKLDEPWDSETNRALLEKMPPIFRQLGVPTDPISQKTKTIIRLFHSEGMPFADTNLKLEDIKNPQGTMLFASVLPSLAVEWTKPEDLVWDVDQIDSLLGNTFFAVSLTGAVDAVTLLPPDNASAGGQRKFLDAFARGLLAPPQPQQSPQTSPMQLTVSPQDALSVSPPEPTTPQLPQSAQSAKEPQTPNSFQTVPAPGQSP